MWISIEVEKLLAKSPLLLYIFKKLPLMTIHNMSRKKLEEILSNPKHPMHNMYKGLIETGRDIIFLRNCVKGTFDKNELWG